MSDEQRAPTPTGARRVPANPDLPRLSKRAEKRVGPADELSAMGYDALEAALERVVDLRHQLEGGHIMVELQVGDTATHIIRDNIVDPKK